jgi:hypothetical protein
MKAHHRRSKIPFSGQTLDEPGVEARRHLCPIDGHDVICVTASTGDVVRVFCPAYERASDRCQLRIHHAVQAGLRRVPATAVRTIDCELAIPALHALVAES